MKILIKLVILAIILSGSMKLSKPMNTFPYNYDDINAQDDQGNTILHRAAYYFEEQSLNFENPSSEKWNKTVAVNFSYPIFRFLLTAKDIDINLKNHTGNTALIGLFSGIFVFGDLMLACAKLFLEHPGIDMTEQQSTINASFKTGINAVLKQQCRVLDNQQALEYILIHVNDKEMLEELLSKLINNSFWPDFNEKIKERIKQLS